MKKLKCNRWAVPAVLVLFLSIMACDPVTKAPEGDFSGALTEEEIENGRMTPEIRQVRVSALRSFQIST